MAQLVISARDQLLARYGKALDKLGPGKSHKVMARAMNYEGRSAFVVVKRTLRGQTSIPRPVIERSMMFVGASTGGGALETKIIGKGRPLGLKYFQPRQFQAGTKATVWGKRQLFPRAFMGPRPGVIAPRLGGNVFHRVGTKRIPIEKLFGPSVPKEMVKDQTAASFYAQAPKIIARVGKEIAAVMRGF